MRNELNHRWRSQRNGKKLQPHTSNRSGLRDDYINQRIEVISLFKCLHHESSGVTNSMSMRVSSPPLCSRRPSEGKNRERQDSGVGREERVHFPPPSSTSTLSRGVTSYLCPGAVSLAMVMARGALSLGWRAGRTW